MANEKCDHRWRRSYQETEWGKGGSWLHMAWSCAVCEAYVSDSDLTPIWGGREIDEIAVWIKGKKFVISIPGLQKARAKKGD